MADDAEKTEVLIFMKKGTSPFLLASRYGTKEKCGKHFCMFF